MQTQQILDKQKQFLWPNHILYYTEPLPLDHGEGLYVWDVEGRRYLDFFGGILTTSVGHNHPQVVEAVREQVGKLIHSSRSTPTPTMWRWQRSWRRSRRAACRCPTSPTRAARPTKRPSSPRRPTPTTARSWRCATRTAGARR
jgi:hypothetical protein